MGVETLFAFIALGMIIGALIGCGVTCAVWDKESDKIIKASEDIIKERDRLSSNLNSAIEELRWIAYNKVADNFVRIEQLRNHAKSALLKIFPGNNKASTDHIKNSETITAIANMEQRLCIDDPVDILDDIFKIIKKNGDHNE